MPTAEPWRYEKLTWPEINDAVKAKKVAIIPVGSTEQHGPHLPMDVDVVCPTGVVEHAARLIPDKVVVLPCFVHGYTGHVMDFAGTINAHYTTFINCMVDIGKSLAYHGFKKIIYLNGHGSNMPNLDLVSRRINLETDAESLYCGWWTLATIDKTFLPKVRESYFPGGVAHACEMETSVYLYLDEDNVDKTQMHDGRITFNAENSTFHYIDAYGAGVAPLTSWTASYSDTGTLGAANLATKEKGRQWVEECAKQLARLAVEFGERPKSLRGDHHGSRPTMDMPWNQGPPPKVQGNVHGDKVKPPRKKNG